MQSFRKTVGNLKQQAASDLASGDSKGVQSRLSLDTAGSSQILEALKAYGPVDRLFAASLMLQRGRPDAAMAILDATTVPGAFWTVYWVVRGRSHFDMQQYREAIAAF